MVSVTQIVEGVMNFLSPLHCLGCREKGTLLCNSCSRSIVIPKDFCVFCKIKSGRGVCHNCAEETHIKSIASVASFHDPLVARLVHAIKFEGVTRLLPPIARRMQLHCKLQSEAVLIPIPMTRFRERMRSYNQSFEIVKLISALSGIPYCHALVKNRGTKQLAKIQDPDTRMKEIIGSFSIQNRALPLSSTPILIDDVVTTGATLREAAATLQRNGYRNISAVTFARS